MLFNNISILDENFELQRDMFVATEGRLIKYVGSTPPSGDFEQEYDGRGRLLIPAFFNAHAHNGMCMMRGYGENMKLSDWLTKRIFPFEALLREDDIYYATLLNICEMLRYGIVSASDMYFFGESMVKAYVESRAKANISSAVTIMDGADYKNHRKYTEAEALFSQYQNAESGRIKIDLSVHAEYTNTENAVIAVAEHAKKLMANMHVHVSETIGEHEECKARHGGLTPVQYLNRCGLFETPATAAHCVHIEEADLAVLKQKSVTVATCPKSNLKLASGILNAKPVMENGINLAIGTDSVASNNNLNMVEELRTFSLIQKFRSGDPAFITPSEALYAATRAGALSQGRNSGLIKEGCEADITVIDMSREYTKPCHNELNNLVYTSSGGDVALTMADGEVLYRDGVFYSIDVERVTAEVERRLKRITDSL